mmetsp:Transcript_28417/g.64346  ORF Transcript_28417/g.64346 Transcript_28417/m.64346 type:complete len:285 (+) Transcript_28417:93-947(+)
MACRSAFLIGGLAAACAADLSAIHDDAASLVQVGTRARQASGQHDLVMAYVPFNFGNGIARSVTEEKWGDQSEMAETKSSIGCQMMYTPGKLWPKDLAEKYFGNRTIFGILRDPYERMVAQFRGMGRFEHMGLFLKCDVNSAIKAMLKEYEANPYAKNCRFLPQAEFFEGPYGASLPVDNLEFPKSVNSMLAEHGYGENRVDVHKIRHVAGCDSTWAGDLDSETRQLIQKVYAKDFELICKHFGRCDHETSRCIQGVPGMCPPSLFLWNKERDLWEPKSVAASH